MELGQKIKTQIIEGLWFHGTYADDFPDSDSILITNKRMTLIVSKKDCVLAESLDESSGLNKPVVIKSVCAFNSMCNIKTKAGKCRKNCKPICAFEDVAYALTSTVYVSLIDEDYEPL